MNPASLEAKRKCSRELMRRARLDPAHREKQKQWYAQNKYTILSRINQYQIARRRRDPAYKLLNCLRARVHDNLFRGATKGGSVIKALGCTPEQLRFHMESKFQPGMTWENHGVKGWHVDHVKPLASFDLTDPAQFAEACHYTNLQPLWAADNIRKSDSLEAA